MLTVDNIIYYNDAAADVRVRQFFLRDISQVKFFYLRNDESELPETTK